MDEQQAGVARDADLDARLARLEELVQETNDSVAKMRKYLTWTFYVTVAVVGIPLILLPFAVSSFITSYTSALGGISGL